MDLRAFVAQLEAKGHLKRISHPVSPILEITEITDRIVKNQGPALLFENTGTNFPVLINAYASLERIAWALEAENLQAIQQRMKNLFAQLTTPKKTLREKLSLLPTLGALASYFPRSFRGRKAPCQEVVHTQPDLGILPILQCWPHDGGRYITLPLVHTVDPETHTRNVGMYRMQVLAPDKTAMHWQRHKTGRRHYEKYAALGKKMPVAVALGGDTVYTYAATAPLPDGIDEYLLAGFLRQKAVQLVRCITQPIEVPADADIVLEGYVDPAEEWVLEGPFGDHTGFYSLPEKFPVFHITAITHRKDALYPATIVGIPPQEDAWLGKATEKIFLTPLKMTFLPELTDLHLPIEGVFHNIALAAIEKHYPGQGIKAIHTLWGAGQLMFSKIGIVLDKSVSCENYAQVLDKIAHIDLKRDVILSRGTLDDLDHACSYRGLGGKLGIDATEKYPEEPPISPTVPLQSAATYASALKNLPQISSFNAQLIERGWPILLLGLPNLTPQEIRQLSRTLAQNPTFQGIKFWILTDAEIDLTNYSDVVWFVSGNVDVSLDAWLEMDAQGGYLLFLDGTRKTYRAPWPNVLAMSPEIIAHVDRQWEAYGLRPFLPSPSLRYARLVVGDMAQAL
ncbi:MAG: menaquinone biosynthesis decarboxylase [Bacteroidia bacterium]